MSKASAGSSMAHQFDFALGVKVLRGFARRLATGRRSPELGRFNEYMLQDIGLTRADIFSAAHGKVDRRD